MVWKTSEETYAGFSWHSSDESIVEASKPLIAQVQAKGGKTAVSWSGSQWVGTGVYLPWKEPSTYAAGYAWFLRRLGSLRSEVGNQGSWFVLGHTAGYDEKAVQQKHGEFNVTPDTDVTELPTESISVVASAGVRESSRPSSSTEASGAAMLVGGTPTLKLLRGGVALASSRGRYRLGDKIGEGSFGEVFSAESGANTVCIKVLKDTDHMHRDASVEAYVLDRCAGHAHIVQLFDVYVGAPPHKRMHMVFELWGCGLRTFQKKHDRLQPANIRQVVSHVLRGLSHLQGLGLLHGDLTPANILVSETVGASELVCKLSDMGSALEVVVWGVWG